MNPHPLSSAHFLQSNIFLTPNAVFPISIHVITVSPVAHTRNPGELPDSALSPPPHSWSIRNYHFYFKKCIFNSPTSFTPPLCTLIYATITSCLDKCISFLSSFLVSTYAVFPLIAYLVVKVEFLKQKSDRVLPQLKTPQWFSLSWRMNYIIMTYELCMVWPQGMPQGALLQPLQLVFFRVLISVSKYIFIFVITWLMLASLTGL